MEVASQSPQQTVSSPVRQMQPTDTPTDLRILIETITSSVLFNGTLSEMNEIERA